jgi:hypothetical protein
VDTRLPERSTLPAALVVALVVVAASPPVAAAGAPQGGCGAPVLDVAPHLWYRMAEALVGRLYIPSLGLFRETWGPPRGGAGTGTRSRGRQPRPWSTWRTLPYWPES